MEMSASFDLSLPNFTIHPMMTWNTHMVAIRASASTRRRRSHDDMTMRTSVFDVRIRALKILIILRLLDVPREQNSNGNCYFARNSGQFKRDVNANASYGVLM